jgi:hypothetical protein
MLAIFSPKNARRANAIVGTFGVGYRDDIGN